jgi:hypothetical protein
MLGDLHRQRRRARVTFLQDPLCQRAQDRALVDSLMREEVLVLGRENRIDEERRNVGGIVDEDPMFGR